MYLRTALAITLNETERRGSNILHSYNFESSNEVSSHPSAQGRLEFV